MTAISYRAGDAGSWLVVASDGHIVAVPGGAVSDALLSAPDASAALDAVTIGGFAASPPFVLLDLAVDGDRLGVLVRGETRVRLVDDAGRETVLDGAGARTWVDRIESGVATARIELAAGSGRMLPLAGGAVWASELLFEPRSAAAPPAGAEAAADGVDAASAPAPLPADEQVGGDEAPPAPVEEDAAEPRLVPFLASAAPAAAPGQDEPEPDTDPIEAEVSPESATERLDLDLGFAPTPSPAPGAGPFELILPGGDRVALGAATIVGRAPAVHDPGADERPQLVTVLGEDVSRTHLRLAVAGGVVSATDLHSSNGTRVAAPGSAPVSLRPGEATPVAAGATIDLAGVELVLRSAR